MKGAIRVKSTIILSLLTVDFQGHDGDSFLLSHIAMVTYAAQVDCSWACSPRKAASQLVEDAARWVGTGSLLLLSSADGPSW